MSTRPPSCFSPTRLGNEPEDEKQVYFLGNLPQILSTISSSVCSQRERTDSDSFSTLLSEQEDDYDLDEDECPPPDAARQGKRSLKQRWKAMEDRFADRNVAFQQISAKTKNEALLQLLWERERAVRTLERECLLLRHGYAKQDTSFLFDNVKDEEDASDDDSSSSSSSSSSGSSSSSSDDDGAEHEDVFYDAQMEAPKEDDTASFKLPMGEEKDLPSMPPLHRAAFLEMRTTVPTSINLVFDCIFYASAFEIVDILMRSVAKFVSSTWVGDDGGEGNLGVVPSLIWLFCSFVILWHSGYLFWWSSREVYSCVKFDLHNQLKLGSWMVQFMRYIREREVLCMSVYMVGYIMAYTSVMMMNERFYSYLFPGAESNVMILLYDSVLLTVSFHVLKNSGFYPWRKF